MRSGLGLAGDSGGGAVAADRICCVKEDGNLGGIDMSETNPRPPWQRR